MTTPIADPSLCQHDVAVGWEGGLLCWLPAGHDGPHWDEVVKVTWLESNDRPHP